MAANLNLKRQGVLGNGSSVLIVRRKTLATHAPLCDVPHIATNIQLDEKLISEAQKLGEHPSKRATVDDALREYVQRRKQLEIFELFGQIDYDENYDYKTARSRK